MLLKRLNWIGWLLLLGPLSLFASSLEQDAGPMSPPKGPFFSSKPLLYFGEEPSMDEAQPSGGPGGYMAPAPSNSMGGYPYYYAPLVVSPNRMPFQQMAPFPQGWRTQRPYYPAYPGQPVYPGNRGYQSYPPFPNRGGR